MFSISRCKREQTTPDTSLPVARLLLNLKAIDNRCQLAQDLVGFLVILQLRGDEIGEVAKRLRRVEDLHT